MYLQTTSKHLILAFAGCAFALSAAAQWQWIDKDGRKTFSDRAPPAEIVEKDILKRPSSAARAAAAPGNISLVTDAVPADPASKASTAKLPGKDAELQARKKKLEDEAVVKKQADEEKLALGKADNCVRAKKGMASFDSGLRLSTINAKGEREVMDDDTRATESKRLQSIIDSDCN